MLTYLLNQYGQWYFYVIEFKEINVMEPNYNFNDLEFKKFPLYLRLAKEHISISKLKSNVVEWEVLERKGKFNIPFSYKIKYKIKSIVAINQDKSPVYGNEHLVKISFPPLFPVKPPFLYAQTDIWHPNIKYADINDKGRICGNTREFGKGFSLYDYVIWIGKIIQYQIYHAEFTPPFPEYTPAAEWMLNYAEPNGIIDKSKKIFVDNTLFISSEEALAKEREEKEAQKTIKPSKKLFKIKSKPTTPPKNKMKIKRNK